MSIEEQIQSVISTIKNQCPAVCMIATAESCTGGMIAKYLTDLPGSSSFFDRGFVTYSNMAKMELLGVDEETLSKYGAVSAQTALEMAKGALENSRSKIALSVTGIAGPGGGSDSKPVGLIYFGIASQDEIISTFKHIFSGSRDEIRTQAALAGLLHLRDALEGLVVY